MRWVHHGQGDYPLFQKLLLHALRKVDTVHDTCQGATHNMETETQQVSIVTTSSTLQTV